MHKPRAHRRQPIGAQLDILVCSRHVVGASPENKITADGKNLKMQCKMHLLNVSGNQKLSRV